MSPEQQQDRREPSGTSPSFGPNIMGSFSCSMMGQNVPRTSGEPLSVGQCEGHMSMVGTELSGAEYQGTREPGKQGTREQKNQRTREPKEPGNQGTEEPKNQRTRE